MYLINDNEMEIVIHGTKGGYKVLYQTPNAPFSVARDVRRIDRNDGNTVGQTAYAIALVNGGCAFTKYVVVRDIERAAIGNVAFSVYIPDRRKMAGRDVKMLLDALAEVYCRNYVIEGNLGNKQEDWTFVAKLVERYEKYCYPEKEAMENYRQGTGEAAYIYYSTEIGLQKYFDYPYQEAYVPYMQIFFVERRYEHTSQDPLNSLRHDPDANLTGKVILGNQRKVSVELPRYEKRDNKNVGEVNAIQRENDIEMNKKGKSEPTDVSNRKGRVLKKFGIWGGIVIIIVVVVIGILKEKETDESVSKTNFTDFTDRVKSNKNIDSLNYYLTELKKLHPEIKEKKGFGGFGKSQKDSTEYKKWENLIQWSQQAIWNLKAEAYLSGTELFYDTLEVYEKLVTDSVLEHIKNYKDFRKDLNEFKFSRLIDTVKWKTLIPSQKRFEQALKQLSATRYGNEKNDRERARDKLKGEIKNMDLNEIAEVMEEVYKENSNKKETILNPSKSQRELSESEEKIKKEIQGFVEEQKLQELERGAIDKVLKKAIGLYRKYWSANVPQRTSYEQLLKEIEQNLYLRDDSKLKKAVEYLQQNNSNASKMEDKRKAFTHQNHFEIATP